MSVPPPLLGYSCAKDLLVVALCFESTRVRDLENSRNSLRMVCEAEAHCLAFISRTFRGRAEVNRIEIFRDEVKRCDSGHHPFTEYSWRYWSGSRRPETKLVSYAPLHKTDSRQLDGMKTSMFSFKKLRRALEFALPALKELTGCVCFVPSYPKQTGPDDFPIR
jgi:hypothetical protein